MEETSEMAEVVLGNWMAQQMCRRKKWKTSKTGFFGIIRERIIPNNSPQKSEKIFRCHPKLDDAREHPHL
jgi:hypothetical protein